MQAVTIVSPYVLKCLLWLYFNNGILAFAVESFPVCFISFINEMMDDLLIALLFHLVATVLRKNGMISRRLDDSDSTAEKLMELNGTC
ncbi:MAG: hypothetical protein IKZ84_17905 [Victivallales bacterium]|nr:hypothetical protein [Victivallales bacterium]